MSGTSPTDKFSVYQHFNRREDLEDVVDTLRRNDIPVRVSDEGQELVGWTEKTIIGAPLRPKFWIEIPEALFEKANFMLREAAEADVSEEDLADHPFNEYSVVELQDVLVHESDWSPEAVVIARRLLLRRGGDVDLKRLRDAARERLAKEYIPKRGSKLFIILLSVLAVFAGLSIWILGIMIIFGTLAYYYVGKRRDPKGNSHYAYDKLTRNSSGSALVVLGISTIVGLINYFYLQAVVFPDIDGWLWWWR